MLAVSNVKVAGVWQEYGPLVLRRLSLVSPVWSQRSFGPLCLESEVRAS
jgi:hypothetical protein